MKLKTKADDIFLHFDVKPEYAYLECRAVKPDNWDSMDSYEKFTYLEFNSEVIGKEMSSDFDPDWCEGFDEDDPDSYITEVLPKKKKH